MADYTVVPASVLASANATRKDGIAGATIVQGDVLYKDTADSNKLKLADANSVTALARTIEGIALDAGSSGHPIIYISKDSAFAPGFTVAIGEVVVLSATPGKLAPASDATSGDYVTVVGVGITGNKINIQGFSSTAGAAKA